MPVGGCLHSAARIDARSWDALDSTLRLWDHPTIAITRTDAQRRIVLPDAIPGEVYEVDRAGEGRYTLVRLGRPPAAPAVSREDAARAITSSPLSPAMSWDELRRTTRGP